jgi:hypothetical protein
VEGQPLPQALKTLRSGQKVLCHDSISKGLRYAEILDVRVENGTAKWVDVVLEDGTNLQMTANHPVLPVAGSQQGSDGTGAVRALDLCPGSDYLMVLKTMPVLVQGIELGTSDESEERVFLTLHQPQRHSLFVASAPGKSASSPTVQTIAVGSADARPQYDIAAKKYFHRHAYRYYVYDEAFEFSTARLPRGKVCSHDLIILQLVAKFDIV